MPAVLDVEQRRKIEATLIGKAVDIVRAMRSTAEGDNPEAVDTQAQALTELLKAKEFPSIRSGEFREQAKLLQRCAYQRSVNTLLARAERRAHAGDEKGRNELLTQAKDHFAKSLRFGADEDFRHGVERRAQALLMTTADGVDQRTKTASARKLEQQDRQNNAGPKPPDGIERRRCRRYGDPVLAVDAGGVHYHTVNWSIRGLLLEPYRPEDAPALGSRVRLTIRCADLPANLPPLSQTGVVVRQDPERRLMAIAFADISTPLLDLLHTLKDAGIQPEPER